MYYIAKDAINVFYFDVLNRTNSNTLAPKLVKVEPKYVHISEFKFNFYMNWELNEDLGFDIESRGFPLDPNFRWLGFSLANDNHQVYFYFSRDDDEYQKELELYGEDIKSIFSSNPERFSIYNGKFENNAILHVFKLRLFFHDAIIYTKMMKTRGSLKFSANLFLGAPIWNESILEFMDVYKDITALYDKTKAELPNNPDLVPIVIETLINKKPDLVKYIADYDDSLEGKVSIPKLLEYHEKGYNSWQACPIESMGYYCCLDSYYTVKLKEMIYDTNYQGVKNGYEFYASQSNFACLLESTHIHIDKDRYDDWSKWAYSERLKHARFIACHPLTMNSMVTHMYNNTYRNQFKEGIHDAVHSFINKRITAAEVSFFVRLCDAMSRELVRSIYDSHAEKTRANLKNIEVGKKYGVLARKKIMNAGMNNDEKAFNKLISITNTKIFIGILESEEVKNNVELKIDYFMKTLDRIRELAQSKVTVSLDEMKVEYLTKVTNPDATYDDYDNLLAFASTKAATRQRLLRVVLPEEHKIVYLKYLFIEKLKTTTIDFAPIKAMTPEQFQGFISTLSTTDEYDNKTKELLVEHLQASLKAVKRTVDGDKLGKHALRFIKVAWDEQYGKKNDKGDVITKLDEYPEFIKIIYHFQLLKRHLKSISTVVAGDLGGNSFVKSKYEDNVPIGSKYQRGSELMPLEKIFYKAVYWNNDKETLRWSSKVHTIPSTLDYSLCFTPRHEDNIFFHLDLQTAEVRLAFAIAKEQKVIDMMLNGADFHGNNANVAFGLGFAEDEIWKIKEDPILNQYRNYAKMLTFAILYGASAGSIGKQIKKPLDEAKKIYNAYFDNNPNFRDFLTNNIKALKENHGFINLPVFGHDFYIGNPFHYSINQKGFNYIIQNISSSLTAHCAFKLWEDLYNNHGINIDLTCFVHDAIEIDLPIKHLILIFERIDYWFRLYPLETFNIPMDYDGEIGMARYSCGGYKFKFSEDRSTVDLSFTISDYYDDKNEIIKRFNRNLVVIEQSVTEAKKLVDKHPFIHMINGIKPACRFNDVETKKYDVKMKIKV